MKQLFRQLKSNNHFTTYEASIPPNQHALLNYSKKEQICEILLTTSPKIIPVVMKNIKSNFPTKTTIVACIPFDCEKAIKLHNLILSYIKHGFAHPYIATKSPLGTSLENYYLCMVHGKSNNNPITEVEYTLTQFCSKNKFCTAKMALTAFAAEKLKELPLTRTNELVYTKNKDGSFSQKEVAGVLTVKDIKPNSVNLLKFKEDSLIPGEEQGVEIAVGLYNFHTHPDDAYIANDVELAWPSEQDYIGFMLAVFDDDTICHFVISKEGFYVITLGEYWAENRNDLDKDICYFIDKNYSFMYEPSKGDKKDMKTINWYLNRINRTKYNGHPLFKLYFRSWDEASKPFDVYYTKKNCNCFTKQTSIDNYLKINKSQECN